MRVVGPRGRGAAALGGPHLPHGREPHGSAHGRDVQVGVALGLSAGTLIAVFPAVNGYFFLPTYGTTIAAIAFDRTGTTRIGRYVLNHSFMVPGLVTTAASLVIGWLLVSVIF